MADNIWTVEGVHEGKAMTALPITYLLWFVGSPLMRRNKWDKCQLALRELGSRLESSIESVEDDLLAGLQPKTVQDRLAIKLRRKGYRQRSSSSTRRP